MCQEESSIPPNQIVKEIRPRPLLSVNETAQARSGGGRGGGVWVGSGTYVELGNGLGFYRVGALAVII